MARRVLFLCGWYPSRVHATLGNFVQRHARVASLVADVHTLSFHSDPSLAGGSWKLETTVQSPTLTEHRYYFSTRRKEIAYLRAIRAAANWYEHAGFDLIHGHVAHRIGFVLDRIYRRKKLPLLVSEHWSGYLPERNAQLSVGERFWLKRLAAKTSLLLPVTDYLGHHMKPYFPGVRTDVWPNVVDTDLFRPGTKSTPPLLLHVSTLDPNKRVDSIIRSAAELWSEGLDFHLAVMGDGDVTPHRALADELDLPQEKFTLLGEQPLETIAEWMRKASLFVLYSVYENFPCVIGEAWASGTPVVSPDLPGIRERFSQEEAQLFLVPPDDPDQLTQKLRVLLHSAPPSPNAEDFRKKATSFSVPELSSSLLRFYTNP